MAAVSFFRGMVYNEYAPITVRIRFAPIVK